MSKALAEAIERLADISEDQLRVMREAEERERRKRWDDPEFVAFVRAAERPLRKMPFSSFVRGMPALADLFQVAIPGEFWAVDRDVIQVSCPCGRLPECRGFYPATCECERAYVFDGADVRVAFSPRQAAA